MPQTSLGRNNKKGITRRLAELALSAGLAMEKVDPQRKGFSEYRDPAAFPIQEEPTDLDVSADSGEEGKEVKPGSELFELNGPYGREGKGMFR